VSFRDPLPEPGADEAVPAPGRLVLERDQPLSRSILWRAQREYFDREGVGAWSTATVPHYATCNPALARAIATVVLGFLRDCEAAAPGAGPQPYHIVELGSGTGRFAFFFLRALLPLLERSCLRGVPIRYVMTDFTETNVAFVRAHPSLEPFVARGLLDFARFDMEEDRALALRVRGETLGPASLARPLVVLANYVFDSVPQDAFHVAGGQIHECLLTVTRDEGGEGVLGPDALSGMDTRFERRLVGEGRYPEPELDAILRAYARALDGTTVALPVAALRCVERLAALSDGRLLLVSGDKGYVRDDELHDLPDPEIVRHGSFSLAVNYHAIGQWFRGRGGEVLATAHTPFSLLVPAFVLGAPGGRCDETRLAYHVAFEGPSADDFFRLRQGIQDHYGVLDYEHLVSLLRLSCHDPRILRDSLPVLAERAAGLSPAQRSALREAVERTWENYYHIGEERDLPFAIATLFHRLGEHATALGFFEASLRLYGERPHTLWNMAMCAFAAGRPDDASRHLARAWAIAPDFQPAVGLLPDDRA
jgi:hypothetical protein